MGERLTSDGRLWRVVLAAALGMLLINLDFFSVQVALPDMAHDLNTTVTDLQWVISGYMLSLAAFLIVGGRLADILGRKTWLIIGAVIFGITSLIGGFAATAELLIIMRILQGVGAAVLMPVCIAVVTNAFPANKVQRSVGMVFGIGAIGQAFGPLAGGLLTDLASWRWVLWVNVPVAAAVILLTLTSVNQSFDESAGRKIDWSGLSLIAVAIGGFTFGIDQASEWGWADPRVLALVLGGVILLGLFVLWELRARPPLLDMSLFRNREFSVMIAAGAIGNGTAAATVFLSMVYLQTEQGFSPIQAGLAFLLFSVGVAISSQIAGRLEQFTSWKVMAIALVVTAVGMPGMGLTIDSVPVFLVMSFFAGAGGGMVWTYASVVTQSVVPAAKAGAASGVVLTVLIGMGGVMTAVAASLTATGTGGGTSADQVIGGLFLAFGAMNLLCAPLVVLFGRDPKSGREAVGSQ